MYMPFVGYRFQPRTSSATTLAALSDTESEIEGLLVFGKKTLERVLIAPAAQR
jgi:hypothetical protein